MVSSFVLKTATPARCSRLLNRSTIRWSSLSDPLSRWGSTFPARPSPSTSALRSNSFRRPRFSPCTSRKQRDESDTQDQRNNEANAEQSHDSSSRLRERAMLDLGYSNGKSPESANRGFSSLRHFMARRP